MEFWQGEYDRSVALVKKTAKIDFREAMITGGTRMDIVVDYGDPGAYQCASLQ